MDSPPVRVLIVDDQAPFRQAAEVVVSLTPGFEVWGQAASGEEGVDMALGGEPDVVLMDINMPGISGIEAVRRITAARPEVLAILLSTYAVGDLPADARTCGAAAYVNKEQFEPEVLTGLWASRGDPAWRS